MNRCAAAALAALLVQCSPATQTTAQGQTFIMAQQREPLSLNPALENGGSSTEWGLLLFSYLVKFDNKGKLIGDIASAVPTLANHGISADGLTVTYHLRRGVRFADGTRLTARDCVYSVDAINNPANNPQSRYGYDVIRKADAPNDTTLVLHLKKPFAPLITLVMAPEGFPILPRHLLAGLPNFNAVPFDSAPIGSGPYLVKQWIHGDHVELVPNAYYWGGVPKIHAISVRFVPDSNTALNLLKTHEIQGYVFEQSYGNYPLLAAIPAVRVMRPRINAVGAIIFNTRDPLTSDARVRHALAEAIDIRSLIAKAYRQALDSNEPGRGLFIWAYNKTAYPDIPYDPAHARALLDSSGWHLGADGLRHKDGRTLDLLFIIQAGTAGDAIIGNAVTQYERAVGANVSIKQFNITQFVAPSGQGGPVYGGKFQMALYPFVNGDDPDTTDQFACANVPPAGYNKSRICDPRIDTLLAQGRGTFDATRRKAAYAKLEALLYRELPIALLYQRRELDAFSARARGQTPSLSTVFWDAGHWTLSP